MEQRLPMTEEQRLRDFIYHAIDLGAPNIMDVVRGKYYALAQELLRTLSDCRERSLALTALEESLMRAMQCLAITYGQPIPPTLPVEVGS